MGSYTAGNLLQSMIASANVQSHILKTDVVTLSNSFSNTFSTLSNTVIGLSNIVASQAISSDFASNASVYTYLSLEAYMNGYDFNGSKKVRETRTINLRP